MLELYLVRHTSVDAPSGTCYGQTDVPLAASFVHEAEEVRRALDGVRFDAVLSSPLSRCTRLADSCGYTTYHTDPRLMEMDFGDWENRLWDDITDPHLQRWFDSWATERTTNGESFADVCHRASLVVDSLSKMSGRVLLFTHAGFIRALWVTLNRCTPNEAFARSIRYGELVVETLDR